MALNNAEKEALFRRIDQQCSGSALATSTETIEICLAFDCNFVQHAAVTLLSATQALGPEDRLIVHVLQAGDIPPSDRDAISELSSKAAVNWYKIDSDRYNKLPDNRSHVSLATYLRLFIPEILGTVSSRVIYLDCDTIVTDNLAKLWNEDLKGCAVAAAGDEGGRTQAERLNFPNDGFYFNAGVLVFDLTEINAEKFWQSVVNVTSDDAVDIELQDQDILNIMLAGQTHRLHVRWNANTRLYTPNELEPAYDSSEALEAAHAPGILHFTDRRKPWNSNCNHPLRELYWDLRNQTPWRESKLDRVIRQFKDQFRNRFSKTRKVANSVG